MSYRIYVVYLVVLLLIALLVSISLIINIIDCEKYIDLLDEKGYEKLYSFNYDFIEIVRKRRPVNFKTGRSSALFQKVNLETEYPVPIVCAIEDNIEVSGVIKNKRYLIFRTEWSKNEIEKLKSTVNKYNSRKVDQFHE